MSGKVTIITPVFNLVENNRIDQFDRCVNSVFGQKYKKISHLVIDGDSQDGTKEKLNQYRATRNISFISERDNGIYNAMNKGVRLAEGEYIIFLNSDDFFLDESVITDLVAKIEEDDKDMVFADARYVDSYNNVHYEFEQSSVNIQNLLKFMPFCHQTLLCKAKMFENHLFNEENKSASDYEWVLEAFFKGAKWDYLNREVVQFSLGGMSDLLRNKKIIRDETIKAFYKVLRTIDAEISIRECQLIYDQYYMSDRLYRLINKHLGITLKPCKELKEITYNNYYDDIWRQNTLLDALQKYAYLLGQERWLGYEVKRAGFEKCYIYGCGRIGKLLIRDFQKSGIEVPGIIDRNCMGQYEGIKIQLVDDESIDKGLPVFVTVIYEYYEIKKVLEDKGFSTIIAIDDYLC